MGREIRRVPMSWEHPTHKYDKYLGFIKMPCAGGQGTIWGGWEAGELLTLNRPMEEKLKPCHDETYQEACEEFNEEALKFIAEHGSLKGPDGWFWEDRRCPEEDGPYRPEFTEEPIGFQIYETVSEGTPISPVFETRAQLARWLIEQGYSTKAAESFAENGFAFSMVQVQSDNGVSLHSDIESCAIDD